MSKVWVVSLYDMEEMERSTICEEDSLASGDF